VAPGVPEGTFRPALESGLGIHLTNGATYDVLCAADVAVVSSGTATVEAALCGAPTVVVYRVSPLTAAIARPLIRAPHFAMVNLIAGRPVVPELIQAAFTGPAVSREVGRLLDSPAARQSMQRDLATVESRLHGPHGDAISRAAEVICEMLSSEATPRRNPPS
jgi:lipid-A-disaccharide synthase